MIALHLYQIHVDRSLLLLLLLFLGEGVFVCFQWLVGVKKQLTTWCKSRVIKGSFFHAWTGLGLLHTPSPARNFAFLISALSIHCASFFFFPGHFET